MDKLRVFVKSGNGGLGYAKMGGIGGDGRRSLVSHLKIVLIILFYSKVAVFT